jgi:hypothetical protein
MSLKLAAFELNPIDGVYIKLIKLQGLLEKACVFAADKNKKQKERSDGNLCW